MCIHRRSLTCLIDYLSECGWLYTVTVGQGYYVWQEGLESGKKA